MKLHLILGLGALFVASIAQAREVTRTEATGDERVISVGECRVKPDLITQRMGYKVSWNVCRQMRSYKVEIEGSGWQAREHRIPGTESEPFYRVVEASETFKPVFRPAKKNPNVGDAISDAAENLSNLSSCRTMRDTMKKLKEAGDKLGPHNCQ